MSTNKATNNPSNKSTYNSTKYVYDLWHLYKTFIPNYDFHWKLA